MMARPTLAALAAATGGRVVGDDDVRVDDVHHDSRLVSTGELFVAIRGFKVDGHDYAAAAVRRGAAALCVEHEVDVGAPQLVVPDTRLALAPLAAAVHGYPAAELKLAGVTGTNGKTTVAHFLEEIVTAAGRRPGLVGTLGARIAGDPVTLARTTPEASDLQRLLAVMAARDVDVAVIEVSSHALALGRVGALVFDVAAFTNLSQDHLDFHGDMEHYFAAKAELFEAGRARHAVVWVDGSWGPRLLREHVVTAFTTVGQGPNADIRAESVTASLDGTRFDLVTPEGRMPVAVRLAGDFNMANALVAAACAGVVGIDLDSIAAGLAALAAVPGRFEPVRRDGAPAVVVDYAHTPAGIEAVVASARRLDFERILVVVGAGGDRDREKRGDMGKAAARGDLVVVTSDNPRSEDPEAIVTAVAAGATAGSAEVVEEPDRRTAIRIALRRATVEDLVLVLGKGHEEVQEVAGGIIPFDDRLVVGEELAAL